MIPLRKSKIATPSLRQAVINEFIKDRRPCAVAARFGLHHNTVKRWLADEGLWPAVVVNGGRGGVSPDKARVEGLALSVAGWSAEADDVNLCTLAKAVRKKYLLALLKPGRAEKARPGEAAAVIRAMTEITGVSDWQDNKMGNPEM